MKYELSYKVSIIIAFLVMIMLSCEKISENPEVIKNDSVGLIDTLPKIDTCFGDTCYTCILNEKAEDIYDQLLDAYYEDSSADLDKILKAWSEISKPDNFIADSLKDIYAVYKAFFSPWDLSRITESEFGDNIYEHTRYYVIRPGISYNYSFKSLPKITYTIDNFRPSIHNESIKLLYLTDTYESAFNCYLGNNNVPTSDSTIFTPDFSHSESFHRYEFLTPGMKFIHDHWSPTWHLETDPMVYSISFNEEGDSALVNYRIAYQGGETILGKKDGEWEVAYFYMTWIE
jgi:hypothetical protein